jgi:hypothetical protein
MWRQYFIWAFIFVLALSPCALAQNKEQAAARAESADKDFPLDDALFALENIRGCLQSFRQLTEEAQGKIPKARLKAIGNTDWDMQELGFANNPNILEGTLKKQDYEIKKLQWERVQQRVKEGKTGEKDLQEARRALENSQKVFQEFMKTFHRKD